MLVLTQRRVGSSLFQWVRLRVRAATHVFGNIKKDMTDDACGLVLGFGAHIAPVAMQYHQKHCH